MYLHLMQVDCLLGYVLNGGKNKFTLNIGNHIIDAHVNIFNISINEKKKKKEKKGGVWSYC